MKLFRYPVLAPPFTIFAKTPLLVMPMTVHFLRLVLAFVWGGASICAAVPAAEFIPVTNWARVPNDRPFSLKVSGVAIDSTGRVYVAHRGPHPVIYFDRDGNYEGTIGESEIIPSVYYDLTGSVPKPMERCPWVHGLHVDPWNNVWVTDVGRHIVMKFNREGKLLMTLGTADVPGDDTRHFNQPTAVLVTPAGEIFVADGYGNSRVVKYDRDGNFILAWGKRGTGPDEFHTPHALALDSRGRLYVTDRENHRIKVYNQQGNLLATWPDFYCVDAIAVHGDFLYGGVGPYSIILKLDLNGKLLDAWGGPRQFGYPHAIALDSEGNLFVAEVAAGRVTKYRPTSSEVKEQVLK